MSPTSIEPKPPPRRGEVWWVSFPDGVGGEIRKTRPAVIVSVDSANRSLNRVQIVPITSRIDRVFRSEALVDVNGEPREAAADQILTVAKERLLRGIGRLSGRSFGGRARHSHPTGS